MTAVMPYVTALWPDREPAGFLAIWRLEGEHTTWLPVAALDGAAAVAARNPADLYLGMGMQARRLRAGRGGAEGVIAIPALWADLDVGKGKAPDRAAIDALLAALEFPPSMIVGSGSGGVHAYWLLKEPWRLDTPEEHRAAAMVLKGWEAHVRTVAEQRHGFTIDSVSDLARVLRIPGTINRKGGEWRPVELLELHAERRYNPSDFLEYVPVEGATPSNGSTGHRFRRWRANAPCPVCTGYPQLPQGQGRRCWGYLDSTEHYARCTREELAGGLRPNNDKLGVSYSHLLTAPCACGVDHRPGEPAADGPPDQSQPVTDLPPDEEASVGPPPPFPVEVLPPAAQRLVCEVSAAFHLDVGFLAAAAFGAMAVAVGLDVEFVPRLQWTPERAILWLGVLGAPGSGKSPAVKAMLHPLHVLEARWRAEHREAMARFRDWKPADDTPQPPKPDPLPRLLVGDTTTEAMLRRLRRDSLLHAADELAMVMGGFNEYKSGRGNDRSRWLALWHGDPMPIDRVTDDEDVGGLYVGRPTLSLVGGIQPSQLKALAGDDGLTPRFLLQIEQAQPWPPGRPPQVSQAAIDGWAALLHRMIDGRPDHLVTITVAPDALDYWMDEVELYYPPRAELEGERVVAQLVKKMPRHVARLALVLRTARLAGGIVPVPSVTHSDLTAARRLGDYFLEHARRTPWHRPDLAASPAERTVDEAVDALRGWLLTRPGREATRRDIIRAHVAGRTKERQTRVLAAFVAQGGHVEKRPTAGGGPPAEVYRL